MPRDVIEEFQRGSPRGIHWYRLVRIGPRRWIIEHAVDGVQQSIVNYRTLKDARAAWDVIPKSGRPRLGRKPRTIRCSDEEYELLLSVLEAVRTGSEAEKRAFVKELEALLA